MTFRQFNSFEEAMEWERLQQEQLKKIITPEQWTLADGKAHCLFYVANNEVEFARVLAVEELRYLGNVGLREHADLRSRGYVFCEVFSHSYPEGEFMDVHIVKTLPLPEHLWDEAVACQFDGKRMLLTNQEFFDLFLRWGSDVQVKG